MGKHFGTDGIRGRVGETPITPELMLHLGYAAGRVFAADAATRPGDTPGVLIGKDTRISGYLLEAALESGLSAGIVISASHNPFEDNGIKFFSAAGTKLPDAVEHAIEEALDRPIACVRSAELGKAFRLNDAA